MRTDTAIVDTSLAVKWVAREPDSPLAIALLDEWTRRGILVAAPALLAYEIANAIHQKVRAGVILPAAAEGTLATFHAIGITLHPPADAALSVRALEIARTVGLGAAYDTQFLALAEHEDCEYWTADRRFWETVSARHPHVRWLGAYQPQPAQPPAPGP
ncbi:MAG TPA: type II toxin-antitoxin system VapC family toxin [Ktedonobacterales bacterium]|nr:type II toxin-antitoxin system VapC family toxin [Ktedonobacterales bacterium]